MAFPGSNYAPPGVYTQTLFENPLSGAVDLLKIPVFIGEGSQDLFQSNLEVVRGSSSTIDQQVVSEDQTGRAVASVSEAGAITFSSWDGEYTSFQVNHYPIVTGDGTGSTTTDRSAIAVTYDGSPIVVLSVNGEDGIIEMAQAPKAGQLVRCTYFFNRTDTLVIDDLSDQVTSDNAEMFGSNGITDISAGGTETFTIAADHNEYLTLTVDGTEGTVTFSAGEKTAANIVTALNNAAWGTLVASTYVNNYGKVAIHLVASASIAIGSGTANATFGFAEGTATARRTGFYVFNGPIVDGSNGGVTTTDPAHVTVKVNGVQVIPSSVDGANRIVTLSSAPAAGATVTATYYFNTWQNTYDYLANIGITSITKCGITPDRNDYIDGTDFVLKDDTILWGTASLVSSGSSTSGAELFGEKQIAATLIDDKIYMAECSSVTNTSVVPAVTSSTQFQLMSQPTTGNGRNSPLGSSLFQTVSNSRIDLPTNRPDLVQAYWGYGVQDALDRGEVEVITVDSSESTITLKSGVPVGATVYATFYYNSLTDMEYTLACDTTGPSGTGTYTITDSGGASLYGASFDLSTKGAGLDGITVQFPSGSEYTPDLRFESVDDTNFSGPLQESVTVSFAETNATPAKFTVGGSGPYHFISSASDKLRTTINNASITVDLANPTEAGLGAPATFLGREITYDAGTEGSLGWNLETDENEFSIAVDGIDIEGAVDPGVTSKSLADVVLRINEGSHGRTFALDADQAAVIATEIILDAGASAIDDYYVGWEITLAADNTGGLTLETREITAYDGATQTATLAAWTAPPQETDVMYLVNPATLPAYTAQAALNGSFDIGAGDGHEVLTIGYKGQLDGGGLGGDSLDSITIDTLQYNSPSTLAAAIQVKIDASAAFNATTDLPNVAVSADSSGQLKFTFRRAPMDADGGVFYFLEASVGGATDHQNFAYLAGIDLLPSAAYENGLHILHGGVASRVTGLVEAGVTVLLHDRLILRNRIWPGDGSGSMDAANALSQCSLEVNSASGNTNFGISYGDAGVATSGAVVKPATLSTTLGTSDGQDDGSLHADTEGEIVAVFYDGTGTKAQNDTFSFVMDGYPVEVVFTSTATGTATPLYAAADADAAAFTASVMGQIATALAGVSGEPFGASLTNVIAANVIRREGIGFRLTSATSESNSRITIEDGSANSDLGFNDGDEALSTAVQAGEVASALMNDVPANVAESMFDWPGESIGTAGFTLQGIAGVAEDAGGSEYLFVQSRNVGVSSSLEFVNATSADALRQGTGLGVEDGDGSVGEAAISGFTVTSSKSAGSGSVASSILSANGLGQDGVVGQTYRDKVTGLTFTILEREGGLSYPTASATIQIDVSTTFTTDANIPHRALNGLELVVANAYGVESGDSGIVETFERGGEEPEIGDVYYTSYVFTKQDYNASLFTKMSTVERNYGAISPENPVSMAAYLAILNGSVVVGVKQVPREAGVTRASLTEYTAAIDDLEGKMPGQVSLNTVIPLRGDSTELFLYLSKHIDVQSSIRYRQERTAIVGLGAGTDVGDAAAIAQQLSSTRFRIVYPDTLLIPVTNALGLTREYLVEGPYLAAMMIGNRASPNFDVATPWTGTMLVGASQLGRQLDAVEQNQAAVKGLTILEDKPPFLRCRHGLTTDMTNVLTKTPTVIQISDEVQRQARNVLARYVGVKFLPGILTQVEGRLSKMFQGLVAGQIISAYTGISADVDSDDPTVANVEAYYQPVFPLLYLVLTFHLRRSL